MEEPMEEVKNWEAEIEKRLQEVREGKVECRDAREAVLKIMLEIV